MSSGEPLPSGVAASRLVQGQVSALGPVLGFTLLRAGLLGVGLYAAGLRRKPLVKGSIYGALAIEAFVLGWAMCTKPQS